MKTCRTHHLACDCREHKAAVLNKAALDAACELDSLSGHFREQLDGFALANIKAIVERVHAASEQPQPLIEVKA